MLHYYDSIKQLYIDLNISKEFGFEAYVYYAVEDLTITPPQS